VVPVREFGEGLPWKHEIPDNRHAASGYCAGALGRHLVSSSMKLLATCKIRRAIVSNRRYVVLPVV